MLRIAIAGCGRIADAHANAIARIHGARIVAACDREELMASQFCERFAVSGCYSDLADLLRKEDVDVVHVTTPPASHFALASHCLDAGRHVLVEKPFTLDAREAQQLVALAEAKGLMLTVGHDEQFSHASRRMRELVDRGYLGGPPVHVESIWCYDLSDEVYAKAFLGDTQHWVRSLPGALLHNVISHGIAKIAEFLVDDAELFVLGLTSPLLSRLGETEIVDELRVTVVDSKKTTANFVFSSQIKPLAHQLVLHGTANGLIVDEDRQTVICLRGQRHKSVLEQFVPPLNFAKQYGANWLRNVRLFLACDFHADEGRKRLIEAFYHSITDRTPPPIPYSQILLTARIMDSVFARLRDRRERTVEATAQTV